MATSFIAHLETELAALETAGLYKSERVISSMQSAEIEVGGEKVLNFCANNYLGLADSEALREAADAGRSMADALEAMRAVTIARLQGWCVGGGLVVAAACDLRVAADSARFSIPEIDLGIPLAWGGIPRLVREIGPALTKELVITCREFSPAEAQAAGFLNRVVAEADLDASVDSLADQVASRPVLPVAATKAHVNAVTAQMVGTARAWSDADSRVGGLLDPECEAARQAYVRARGR